MRRVLIVCVGMVLVCAGSAFGGEPKWVWAPEMAVPEWAVELLGERRARDSIDDFSVLDGTVLAIDSGGGFVLIRRADGVEVQVRRRHLGDQSLLPSQDSLFKDYYLQLFGHYGSMPRTFLVKPGTETLSVEGVHFRWWILRERLSQTVWLQQAMVARARGESQWPQEPESGGPPRRLLFYFDWQEVLSYAAAEDRLVVVLRDPGRTLVVCFDLHSGQILWSREIAEVTVLYGLHGLRVTGGVVNLVFLVPGPRPGALAHVALDLNTGSLLRRQPMIGLDLVPRLVREQGGRRLLLLRKGMLREYRGYLKLLEEDATTEVWSVRPPEWREFKLDVAQGNGEVFVPFRKGKWLTPPEGVSAPEKWLPDEPWVPEAQRDPLTHGVMCYDLSDGRLKATYGLDYKHLSDAPRDAVPDGVYWANYLAELESPPIVTEDLVILSPVELTWNAARVWAIAVFSRQSGELLDVLWTPVISLGGMRSMTSMRKMELHGNELFLLTQDARLCCFELPQAHARPDAGE